MKKIFSIFLLLISLIAGCGTSESIDESIESSKDTSSVELSVEMNNEEEKEFNQTEQVIDNGSESNSEQIPVEFVRVIDGDSIKVKINGVEETVRYLLIDTPETKHPNSCVQPYGKEASERNEELLRSGQITLEFDGPERDKYDRLLAYVFVDGLSVQKTLLEEGLARVAYIYDPPYKYLDEFYKAESEAKSSKLNIWNKDGYVTENGFQDCVDDDSVFTSTSLSDNDTTDNVEYFNNCTELKKVYPNGVPKEHPAYQEKMDRDKDGYACE